MLGTWEASISLTSTEGSPPVADDNDFYEEDESLEKIQEIRAREPDFVTAAPSRRGVTLYLNFPGDAVRWNPNTERATA